MWSISFLKINWQDDFDSVILGHATDLSRITGINFEDYFVDHCIKYNKSLFSFTVLNAKSIYKMNASKISWYYPCVTSKNIPKNTFGKLQKISKPVVAVVGTSQRQEKFTLQLKLKMLFEQSSYKIGMLGTEPSSLLFGVDEVYPMGFVSAVYVDGYDSIIILMV